jgi:hypothetical protein
VAIAEKPVKIEERGLYFKSKFGTTACIKMSNYFWIESEDTFSKYFLTYQFSF